MIQLNLLPDVKLEYITAQRSRRLVLTVAIIVSTISLALLLILLSVLGLQKKHLNDLNRDISNETQKLQGEPQITKILTVQNQLSSLTPLHAGKPAVSNLFTYLNQVTPAQVDITSFKIDFTQQTISITGSSDALSSVNKYIDTLKFTTYTSSTVTKATKAFSNTVLSSFGVNTGTKDAAQAVNYTIGLSYDRNIFDITQNINLSVPKLVTTRSELEKPSDLFIKAPATTTTGGGN
jgi:Tfp pilus assembly protein PilN